MCSSDLVLDLISLIRIPLGTPYLDVVKRLRATVTRLIAAHPWGARAPRIHVVIDSAGPGQVMIELIRAEQLDIRLVPVVLTGGVESGRTATGKYSVPRRELVSNARLLLENEVIRVAAGLAFGTLAAFQSWFADLQPWVDVQFAITRLFDNTMTAEYWQQLGVTTLVWLWIPLALGLRAVLRAEVK